MKVLIISDSHGFSKMLEEILKKERSCDAVIHLGDGGADMLGMNEYVSGKPFFQLKGNCDLSAYNFSPKLISYFDKVKFYACHGDAHNVKGGLLSLCYAAREYGCKLALYGHTHIQNSEVCNGITLFNPGSVQTGHYGILQTEGDTFTLTPCIVRSD